MPGQKIIAGLDEAVLHARGYAEGELAATRRIVCWLRESAQSMPAFQVSGMPLHPAIAAHNPLAGMLLYAALGLEKGEHLKPADEGPST